MKLFIFVKAHLLSVFVHGTQETKVWLVSMTMLAPAGRFCNYTKKLVTESIFQICNMYLSRPFICLRDYKMTFHIKRLTCTGKFKIQDRKQKHNFGYGWRKYTLLLSILFKVISTLGCSLSLRCHVHGSLAKCLMHMAHFSGNTSGV